MLLPRFPLPTEVAFPSPAPSPAARRAALLRHRQHTIDDDAHRYQLARMLAAEPLGFLSVAATTISVLGEDTADLVFDLLDSHTSEAVACAQAMIWLQPGPAVEPLDAGALPPWLARLDATSLTDARRRRDGPELATSSYLVEVTLADGRVGTLHARIDHARNGSITHAFAVDEPRAAVQERFALADRFRRFPDRGPTRRFRPLKPATARRALAGALLATDEVDQPVDLLSPWPGIRPLVCFLLHDLGAQVDPGDGADPP